MRLPPDLRPYFVKDIGTRKTDEIYKRWFYLTLANYRYIEDGDPIGFINCKTGKVSMGHLFCGFTNDWKRMKLYFNSCRKQKNRIMEIEVGHNLFFFKKSETISSKFDDAFFIYYMLEGLENGSLVVKR